MKPDNTKIVAELRMIRKDIEYIKEHMIDIDSLLSKEESKQLDESVEEFKKGKTTKLEDFKKELGI